MFRPRDAVLGLLAVSLGSAGRTQNTQKASAAAGMINMLAEHIGTKGETANTQVLGILRELGQETPGAEQSLNEILGKAIENIKADVSSLIIAGHSHTQEEANRRVDALDAATQNAVAQKTIADQDDSAWFSCVGDEKAALKAVEDADAALVQAEGEVGEPCQQQEDRRSFSADPTTPVFEECDVSLQGNCDAQVENFQSQVNSVLESLKNDLAADQASYNDAKQRCDAAKANVESKKSALGAANAAFSSQKDLCSQKHETRSLNMCLFGTDLQAKCEAVTSYERLFLDTHFTGNEFSHVDRIDEWKTAETSICVLNKVIGGGPLGAEVIAECEQAIDYERDVGIIDKQESRFEELTTPEKFTCSESNISFIGETWTFLGDATKSTDYVTEPYHPAVDLAVGSPPFSFCGGAPAPLPQEAGPGKSPQ